MNSSNYGIRSDHNLRKSFIIESYNSQMLPGNVTAPTLVKRSSLNQNQNYPPPLEHPKTPKAMPVRIQGLQVSNQYYHQSNYHNSYKTQPCHPNINNLAGSRIQSFNLEQRKQKQNSLEDTIRQISYKLQKTINQVEKHQISLKSLQSSSMCMPNLQPQALAKIITQTVNDRFKGQQIQLSTQFNSHKSQIQQIRQHINKFVEKLQIEDKIKKVGMDIGKAIEDVREGLKINLSQMSENHTKARKKQIQKFKTQIQEQIFNLQKTFNEKLRKEKQEWDRLTQCSSIDTIPSRKAFIGDPILVKFASKVSIVLKGSSKQLQQSQTIYKLDDEGYLLDSQGKYILNSKYQQVKLSNQQLQIIRDKGILK